MEGKLSFDLIYQTEMFSFRSVGQLFISVWTSISWELELRCLLSLDFICQNPL